MISTALQKNYMSDLLLDFNGRGIWRAAAELIAATSCEVTELSDTNDV